MTRLERWERADVLGLCPPEEVRPLRWIVDNLESHNRCPQVKEILLTKQVRFSRLLVKSSNLADTTPKGQDEQRYRECGLFGEV
jgi:hypothetical protein